MITMALFFFNNSKKLILIDDKTNIPLMVINLLDHKTFSVEFIHSVNKSKVIDFYTYDSNNNIIVYKTVYYNFGAGVETELIDEEKLTFGDNGEMIVSNINKTINPLIYTVGTIYDHILKIQNITINLNNTFGRNRHIRFIIL